jgi:hypothetical protein
MRAKAALQAVFCFLTALQACLYKRKQKTKKYSEAVAFALAIQPRGISEANSRFRAHSFAGLP